MRNDRELFPCEGTRDRTAGDSPLAPRRTSIRDEPSARNDEMSPPIRKKPTDPSTPSRIPPFVGGMGLGGAAGEVFDVFGESLGSESEGFGHGQVGVEGVGDLVDRGPMFDCHDGGLDDVTGSVGEDVDAQ